MVLSTRGYEEFANENGALLREVVGNPKILPPPKLVYSGWWLSETTPLKNLSESQLG